MSNTLDSMEFAPLAAAVGEHIASGRRECRLPHPIVEAIVGRGLFRAWIPARYGGLELPLPAALRLYEAAAKLDGAVGWSVMIGSGGGLFAAYLPQARAEEYFRPRAAVVAGSGAVGGTAAIVPGGYRVTGRWRYASGADYATVFTANCAVTRQGLPASAGDKPLIRAMVIDPADVVIHRTWETTGLRATGSHDIEVNGAFVRADSTFSVLADAPLETGALYRIPFGVLTELPVSAVALGIAERALEEFTALARSKPATDATMALDQVDAVSGALGHARQRVSMARHELYETAQMIWEFAQSPGPIPGPTTAAVTVTSVRIVRSLVAAVADLVPLAGMNALKLEDPFSIAWRDLEAAAAHYSVSPLRNSAVPTASGS